MDGNLANKLIYLLNSLSGVPDQFICKANNTSPFYVNCRRSNVITIKNLCIFLLINEISDRFNNALLLTKIDLNIAYHCLQIRENDKLKTIFQTKYELFKYLLTSFELTNPPASLKSYVYRILRRIFDSTVLIYLDDFLLYLRNSS